MLIPCLIFVILRLPCVRALSRERMLLVAAFSIKEWDFGYITGTTRSLYIARQALVLGVESDDPINEEGLHSCSFHTLFHSTCFVVIKHANGAFVLADDIAKCLDFHLRSGALHFTALRDFKQIRFDRLVSRREPWTPYIDESGPTNV